MLRARDGLFVSAEANYACRRLYQIVKNSLVLQYRIAQLASNVIDTGKSSLNIRKRLDLLYQFERNWTTLDFTSTHKTIKRNSDTWELTRGVLAFGFGRTRKPPSGLDFTQTPSNMRTTQGRTWRYDDLNVNIRDFTIDPCQDLVVVIERPNTFE
ncbi:hypothetical protein Clacol_004118 [Clathrus columnatus]|uniref:Uncharacterized protein n=1 Tax=Clathrus columnatus TaxID=1419009 RepID=A0AAV5AB07_9AGAM|nr:hypothetical protein Clacol_004118 [Clathrus columnatus]